MKSYCNHFIYFRIKKAANTQHDLLCPLTECTRQLSPDIAVSSINLQISFTISFFSSNIIFVIFLITRQLFINLLDHLLRSKEKTNKRLL